jgi:L-ectoine synthase
MFVRSIRDVEKTDFFVEWGSGTSHRLLTVRRASRFHPTSNETTGFFQTC